VDSEVLAVEALVAVVPVEAGKLKNAIKKTPAKFVLSNLRVFFLSNYFLIGNVKHYCLFAIWTN
jgi:hypothetical protein